MRKKVLSVLGGFALFLVWGSFMMYISMPDELTDITRALTNVFSKEDGMLYTIDDGDVPLAAPASSSGVSYNGWLQVVEGSLQNQQGEALQLRGMSSHGLAWFPEYTSAASIQTTKHYGANLFRIAMYVDDTPGNYTRDEKDQQENKEALYAAIDNTLMLDMYAVADWHILEDPNPLNRLDCALAFFDELSQKYADKPGLIYEICNEPNGDTTWDDIYEYADLVIPIIRANSPKAVIIVGTPMYSGDLTSVMANPLPYDNILYAYHYYSGNQRDNFDVALAPAMEANFPVFISEWGFGSEIEPHVLMEEPGKEFIAYMKAHNLSWANWSLCNKRESFSAILPDVKETSGWTMEELTTGGQIVFEALKND